MARSTESKLVSLQRKYDRITKMIGSSPNPIEAAVAGALYRDIAREALDLLIQGETEE
jgi:hypothetical protein